MESVALIQMAWRCEIKKGKEVQKMMRGALGMVAIAMGVLLAASLHAPRAEASAPVIVALGDSLTAGFGLQNSDSFPAQLEKALKERGQDVTVINAGVSGDTAAAGLARLDWALPDNADAVIVELGANDALQGLDPAATKASLEKMITDIKRRGLPILLAGMEAPRNLGKDYVDQFRVMYEDLARRYDLILYPFFLDGVALDNKYMLGDGLHPNAEGVARIVEGILPKVEELLARVNAKEVR
jgi:acyl-CoA thioesterase-1